MPPAPANDARSASTATSRAAAGTGSGSMDRWICYATAGQREIAAPPARPATEQKPPPGAGPMGDPGRGYAADVPAATGQSTDRAPAPAAAPVRNRLSAPGQSRRSVQNHGQRPPDPQASQGRTAWPRAAAGAADRPAA